jgi:hypothetical protein
MKLPDVPKIVWVIVAIALLIAMIQSFYGDYSIRRVVSCGYFWCDVEFSRGKMR